MTGCAVRVRQPGECNGRIQGGAECRRPATGTVAGVDYCDWCIEAMETGTWHDAPASESAS